MRSRTNEEPSPRTTSARSTSTGPERVVPNAAASVQRSPVLDVVGKGGGTSLPAPVRSQMERSIGADFGDVRIHTDPTAAVSASAIGAAAYTSANEVVFGAGQYAPHTRSGAMTLAHELTHVVQQRAGQVSGTATGDGIRLSSPDDRHEREADAMAARVVGTR